MRRSAILTLTTDFGTRDHYAGAMKGVVSGIAPDVRILDITHEVPGFDVAAGAFAIAQAYPYYPRGTVHVVVVDPGVGSSRRPIAVRADGHLFVSPDNGVLSHVVREAVGVEARRIDPRHGLAAMSRTFHGRDLFAPVGARLAAGLPFDRVGPDVPGITLLPAVSDAGGAGCVLHVDGFGNVVTSFRETDLSRGACLAVAGTTVCRRADSYAAVPPGRLFLIVGSSGYVEISLNRGSAADALGAREGDSVAIAGTACGPDQSARDNL